jgi:hypothetical protein
LELYRTLKSEGEGGDAAASALAALMAGISNSGYQLVVSAGVPQPVKDQVQQCCGSGIRCFFTPRIRDPGWSSGRIRIRDKQTKFVNSLYTKIGRIRDPVLFYPPDPEWSTGRIRIRDPG